MVILGIESSADETAAAVVRDGRVLLGNAVQSQIDIHKQYGGIVPEIAARSHIEAVIPVIETALTDAGMNWDDIDAIGVTKGPGLSGALLMGTLTARTIAWIKDKPLYGVHHILGHTYANWLNEEEPQFPVLALIVSGGHSQLMLFKGHYEFEVIGRTQDDAVGEAFDKVAKILGLPYPGGPSVEAAGSKGDPLAYSFPKARMPGPYDFSFSGLKTAVLRRVQDVASVGYDFPSFKLAELLSEQQVNNIAASFQHIALDTLVDKTEKAFNEFSPKTVIIGGGVASSKSLREKLQKRLPIDVQYAPPYLCTDNAAMIASLTYYFAQSHQPDDPHTMEIVPSWPL